MGGIFLSPFSFDFLTPKQENIMYLVKPAELVKWCSGLCPSHLCDGQQRVLVAFKEQLPYQLFGKKIGTYGAIGRV